MVCSVKKKAAVALLAATLCLQAAPGMAAETELVVVQIGNTSAFANGVMSEMPAAPELLVSGTTFVPVAAISELLGGEFFWDEGEKRLDISLNGTEVSIWIDQTRAVVDGAERPLAVPPRLHLERTMVPLAFISETLGYSVYWNADLMCVGVSSGVSEADFNESIPYEFRAAYYQRQAEAARQNAKPASESISYSRQTVAGITVDVVRADLGNPNVGVRALTYGGKLDDPASFQSFIDLYSPIAAVNGNFFNAYGDIQDPVGNLMSDGEMLYASAGLTTLGITSDNKIVFGDPGFFTYTVFEGGAQNAAYEVNVLSQAGNQSVLYTPARGRNVAITEPGSVMTVRNGKVSEYREVSPGESAVIPADGYAVFYSIPVMSESYFHIPSVGEGVTIEHRVFGGGGDEFDMNLVTQMVTGSPCLVRDGQADDSALAEGFAGDGRFSPDSTLPRTAVGRAGDQTLVIVSATATLPQLKAIMLELGCTDAVNIDGGASQALYADGGIIRAPGRNLTTVLVVSE